MLSRREYVALVASFILIFLEGVIRIITLGLRELERAQKSHDIEAD